MRWVSVLAAVLVAVVLAGCGSASKAPAAASTASSSGDVFARIPGIVDDVQPSVVSVLVTTPQGGAIGSGVIWSADGVIVTNNHVVANAQSIQVAFANGERVKGKVKATDPLSDLAVVTVDRKKLPAAKFRSSPPEVGELAVALGTPLGFADTVTAGIVSGLHRSLPGQGREAQALVDLLQTDAAISPR